MTQVDSAFISDIATLRARARKSLEQGAVTSSYQGDVNKTIELLQGALASEIVCVLRYKMHAISAEGIDSKTVGAEFAEHAEEEAQHMTMIAERIDQLGGVPDFSPEGLTRRAATEYGSHGTLVEMMQQDLIAERIAIEHYSELIRYFADHDPTTERMMKHILAEEEEHASDLHDLLVAHQGKPFIDA